MVNSKRQRVHDWSKLKFAGIDGHALQAVLVAYLSTRLMIFLIIFVSSISIPMRAGSFLYAIPDNLISDGLVRDDSWWYVNIVDHGYSIGDVATRTQGNAVFFPLYPILIRIVMLVIGNAYYAGMFVSQIALLVALFYLYRLVSTLYDHQVAARAVFYLAIAPASVFFSAVYTESLFVALVCATFYYAQQRQWLWATLAAALASATRNTGLILAAVIALEGMHQQGIRFLPATRWAGSIAATCRVWYTHIVEQMRTLSRCHASFAAAAWAPFGLLLFMIYLTITFDDPLAFIHTQATWGRPQAGFSPTRIFGHTLNLLNIGPGFWAGEVSSRTLLEVMCTLLLLPIVVAVASKLRPAYGLYSAFCFLLPLSTGTVGSMLRYSLVLVPCFIMLAYWGQRSWVDRFIVAVFLPLMSYLTIIFSHWYFAG